MERNMHDELKFRRIVERGRNELDKKFFFFFFKKKAAYGIPLRLGGPEVFIKDRYKASGVGAGVLPASAFSPRGSYCPLYTSDAADDKARVDLGVCGLREKQKNNHTHRQT